MELEVGFGSLRDLGNALKAEADRMQGELTALGGKANPDHCWRGVAATAYWERFEQWQAGTKQAIEALNAMGPMLIQVADLTENQQIDIATKILNGS